MRISRTNPTSKVGHLAAARDPGQDEVGSNRDKTSEGMLRVVTWNRWQAKPVPMAILRFQKKVPDYQSATVVSQQSADGIRLKWE